MGVHVHSTPQCGLLFYHCGCHSTTVGVIVPLWMLLYHCGCHSTTVGVILPVWVSFCHCGCHSTTVGVILPLWVVILPLWVVILPLWVSFYHCGLLFYHCGCHSTPVGCHSTTVGCYSTTVGCYSTTVGCHSTTVGCYSTTVGVILPLWLSFSYHKLTDQKYRGHTVHTYMFNKWHFPFANFLSFGGSIGKLHSALDETLQNMFHTLGKCREFYHLCVLCTFCVHCVHSRRIRFGQSSMPPNDYNYT